MNRFRVITLTAILGLLGMTAVWNAKADAWDKKTVLTVHESIQIPGLVLQPGEYVMKLADSQSNRHIVQVFNGEQSQILTTILAIPNYRLQPTDKTMFTFWETPAGQPRAMRAWFYPGDNFGQEFAYPKEKAAEIAQVVREPVPTLPAEPAEVAPAPQPPPDPEPARVEPTDNDEAAAANPPQEPAREEPPKKAEEPAAAAQPAEPAPQPSAAEPQKLPATASYLPLMGLAGFLSLGAAGVLRAFTKR
jgi:hypothetical protein